MPEISESELAELREKAEKYDKMIEARRKGAMVTNSVSKEELRARAKKAVAARMAKYGQQKKS